MVQILLEGMYARVSRMKGILGDEQYGRNGLITNAYYDC